jgi:hypothetical protein
MPEGPEGPELCALLVKKSYTKRILGAEKPYEARSDADKNLIRYKIIHKIVPGKKKG